MRLVVAVLIGVALTGCSRDQRDEPYSCDVPESGPVTSEYPMRCGMVRNNILLARDVLVSEGILGPDQAAALIRRANFHFHASICLNADEEETGQCLGGYGYPGSADIDLAVAGGRIGHELVHLWMQTVTPVDTALLSPIDGHANWTAAHWRAGTRFDLERSWPIYGDDWERYAQ